MRNLTLIEVVSVKFNCHGKAYYFDPSGIAVSTGSTVIVETAKGLDIGDVTAGPHYVTDESVVPPLRPVIRLATEDDLRQSAQNKQREKEAFAICRQKIKDHGLDMKLVDVECSFEGNKILFFFTADGRVDFRDLVKDLASVFRMRIELRQIGVRDETKMLGGLGICGRPYCCSQFLGDFQPVSTKMAKTQNMSLNPTKISGSCGRLMCCLRYEEEAYEDLLKTIPKNGTFVRTPDGYGNVIATNVLRQKIKVRIDEDGEDEFRIYDALQIAVVPGGRPKPGEPVPFVELPDYHAAPPTAEPEESDDWNAPNLFAEEMGNGTQPSPVSVQEEQRQAPQSAPRQQEQRQRNRQRPQGGGQKQGQPNGGQQGNGQQRQGQPGGQKPRQGQNGQKQGGQQQGQRQPNGPKPQNQQRPNPPKPNPNGEAAAAGEEKPKPNRNRRRRPRNRKPGEGGQGTPNGQNPQGGQSAQNNQPRPPKPQTPPKAE